jgi:hypothetical protein
MGKATGLRVGGGEPCAGMVLGGWKRRRGCPARSAVATAGVLPPTRHKCLRYEWNRELQRSAVQLLTSGVRPERGSRARRRRPTSLVRGGPHAPCNPL